MARYRKIRNFPLPIYWDPELLTAQELYEERHAAQEAEAEMAAERYYERGSRPLGVGPDDYYDLEEAEKNLANWGPPPMI